MFYDSVSPAELLDASRRNILNLDLGDQPPIIGSAESPENAPEAFDSPYTGFINSVYILQDNGLYTLCRRSDGSALSHGVRYYGKIIWEDSPLFNMDIVYPNRSGYNVTGANTVTHVPFPTNLNGRSIYDNMATITRTFLQQ